MTLLPPPVAAKLPFVTAGSGITPVVAMLRSLKQRGESPAIIRVDSARSAGEVIFRDELRALERDQPDCRATPAADCRHEQVDFAALDSVVSAWTGRSTRARSPSRSRQRHRTRRRDILLEGGEKLGIQMPFGCRMGICQSCVWPMESGHVRHSRSGTERGAGDRIQTCISAVSGDCTINI